LQRCFKEAVFINNLTSFDRGTSSAVSIYPIFQNANNIEK
jgi:hypothetical protein